MKAHNVGIAVYDFDLLQAMQDRNSRDGDSSVMLVLLATSQSV